MQSCNMNKQTQTQMYFQFNSQHNLSVSKVSQHNSSEYEVKLPPNSQPLISQYRGIKLKMNYFRTDSFRYNIFTDFLCGKSTDQAVSMCEKCQRSRHLNLCSFVLSLVEQKYDWKNDIKFRSTYDEYNKNKKKIHVFLTDQQIQYRLESKFNILGVILLQNHKLLLMRIIRNYIKHTIYYGDYRKLTLQNDLYFWFLIGIYYHIGVPKFIQNLESLPKDPLSIHEPLMFWMLDIVMNKLGDCSQYNLRKLADETLTYCRHFYKMQCSSLSDQFHINLNEIFYQWFNQAMMGYMGIEFIGFFIKCILTEGLVYIQKTIMSYFQKRVAKIQSDQLLSLNMQSKNRQQITPMQRQDEVNNKRERIMKGLLNSQEEWPNIFFNTSAFDFR